MEKDEIEHPPDCANAGCAGADMLSPSTTLNSITENRKVRRKRVKCAIGYLPPIWLNKTKLKQKRKQEISRILPRN